LSFEGQTQKPTALSVGVPQGSPVSPILFLLYIRDIVQDLGYQLSFIDDISISVTSTSARKNYKVLSEAYTSLITTANEAIQFDPKKTELIHLSRTRTPFKDPIRLPNGPLITPKKVVKWLGIWFDYRLSFHTHVEKRTNLALGAAQQIQRLAYRTKGLSFKALRLLYLSVICPIADYGSQLWYSLSKSNPQVKRLQQIQNQALYQICGAFRGTPYRALEIEAAILPPDLRLYKAFRLYAVRSLRFNSYHPIKIATREGSRVDQTQLLDLMDSQPFLHKANIEALDYTWNPPWSSGIQAEIRIQQIPKSPTGRLQFQRFLDSIEIFDPYIMYTDGSKGKSTTGAAICMYYQSRVIYTESFNLGARLEIADAESFAASRAIQLAYKRIRNLPSPTPQTVYLCIDSQAAIQRLQNTNFATT
jgi:reverse transcriptase-like protein